MTATQLFWDNSKPVDIINSDFAKAFNMVPHERLLLKWWGVEGKVLEWTAGFLRRRRQLVRAAGTESDWVKVLSDIPQGSVLGPNWPVLFVCFINDLPDSVTSMALMYADVTKLSRRAGTKDDQMSLQAGLHSLDQRSTDWQLKFNAAKCKVMHLRAKINGPVMVWWNLVDWWYWRRTALEKDLGVWMDNKLKFTERNDKAVTKSKQLLGLIYRTIV